MNDALPVFELFIPHLPKTMNNLGTFKFARTNENRKWNILLKKYSRWKKIVTVKSCTLELHRFGKRYLDYDNLVSSFKSVVDALKNNKIIQDDSYALTSTWRVCQSVSDKTGILIKIYAK